MSKLIFKYSTMGAGKSADLLVSRYNFLEKGRNVLLIKSSIDNRYKSNEYVMSRLGISAKCDFLIHENESIRDKFNDIDLSFIDFILVDEVQFLNKNQIDELASIVDDYDNITIICYGLRTDFKTNLFEGSKRLIEVCDKIVEMKSTCKCGKKSIYNMRIDKDGNIVTEGNSIKVGDSEYIPVCRKCYNDYVKKLNK